MIESLVVVFFCYKAHGCCTAGLVNKTQQATAARWSLPEIKIRNENIQHMCMDFTSDTSTAWSAIPLESSLIFRQVFSGSQTPLKWLKCNLFRDEILVTCCLGERWFIRCKSIWSPPAVETGSDRSELPGDEWAELNQGYQTLSISFKPLYCTIKPPCIHKGNILPHLRPW